MNEEDEGNHIGEFRYFIPKGIVSDLNFGCSVDLTNFCPFWENNISVAVENIRCKVIFIIYPASILKCVSYTAIPNFDW